MTRKGQEVIIIYRVIEVFVHVSAIKVLKALSIYIIFRKIMFQYTIVARCDGIHAVAFCTPEGGNGRVPFATEGVQNPWTPVTACNNCFVIPW